MPRIPRFFVLLKGSIIVTYTPEVPPTNGLPPRLPIARLTKHATVGATSALCGEWGFPNGLSFVAGEEGATILSWNCDE